MYAAVPVAPDKGGDESLFFELCSVVRNEELAGRDFIAEHLVVYDARCTRNPTPAPPPGTCQPPLKFSHAASCMSQAEPTAGRTQVHSTLDASHIRSVRFASEFTPVLPPG